MNETTIIGRGSDCGLRVASVEVSRKHCRIDVMKDKATLTDLGSSNGTFLNSQKITPNIGKPLISGSFIQIGPLEATIQLRYEKEVKQVAPKVQQQVVNRQKVEKKLNETDATVAMDPMSAKRAERKKMEDTLPMAPNMQELYAEALEYEEIKEIKSPPAKPLIVQSTPAVDKTIELDLVDDDIVQDSSPELDYMLESSGSDIIIFEDESALVPEDKDAEQDIVDFLKNMKDDA